MLKSINYLLIFLPVFLAGQETFQVEGAISIQSSVDATPKIGTIQWTGSDFQVWNGILWISLTDNATVGKIYDVDSNDYKTIRIGEQEWMTENLRVTKFKGGTPISEVMDSSDWMNKGNGQIPSWCWFNNQNRNENPFGKLYNWFVVKGDSICPQGWSVPADTDFVVMQDFLGGAAIAGGKLKQDGLEHWQFPNQGATNESGFSGLPGGYRTAAGTFRNFGLIGRWWSKTPIPLSDDGYYYRLDYLQSDLAVDWSPPGYGYSIRCFKNL